MFVDVRSNISIIALIAVTSGLGCGVMTDGNKEERTSVESYAVLQTTPDMCEGGWLTDCFWAKIDAALANETQCTSECSQSLFKGSTQQPPREFCEAVCRVKYYPLPDYDAQATCESANATCDELVGAQYSLLHTAISGNFHIGKYLGWEQSFMSKAYEVCADRFDSYGGEEDSCSPPATNDDEPITILFPNASGQTVTIGYNCPIESLVVPSTVSDGHCGRFNPTSAKLEANHLMAAYPLCTSDDIRAAFNAINSYADQCGIRR